MKLAMFVFLTIFPAIYQAMDKKSDQYFVFNVSYLNEIGAYTTTIQKGYTIDSITIIKKWGPKELLSIKTTGNAIANKESINAGIDFIEKLENPHPYVRPKKTRRI